MGKKGKKQNQRRTQAFSAIRDIEASRMVVLWLLLAIQTAVLSDPIIGAFKLQVSIPEAHFDEFRCILNVCILFAHICYCDNHNYYY